MRTLIITDSWDTTTDIVVRRIGERAFRLNTDIIRDYKIDWTCGEFELTDPTGRSIHSTEVGSVYWRKPFTAHVYDSPNESTAFFYSECRYAIRELYNYCLAAGASALVEEGAERRLGKIRQLLVAGRYFRVPEWRLTFGTPVVAPENTVVKSLSGEPVNAESVLYTSRVDGGVLDAGHLWFTQQAIDKSGDVTVVFVDDRVFAFRCAKFLETVDWRERIPDMQPQDWKQFYPDLEFVTAVRAFMKECGLRYGRLDFVEEAAELFFLEVNPNGQWAWLDLDGKAGLLNAMVNAIEALPRPAFRQ